MKTHEKFNHQDKHVLKSLFIAYPRAKCIVDLERQQAYLVSNGVRIADIEKRPDEWGIRITAPIRVKFVEKQFHNKTVVYALFRSIYESIRVVVNDPQRLNYIGKQFLIPIDQLFTFTDDKKYVLVGCIDDLEINVKRSEWNKMAAFRRNVDYKVHNLH